MWEGDWAKFWPLRRILAVSMAVARQGQALILHEKIKKIGSRGGIGMGSNSGWPHALGCPEWVPPGAGSREGVLGTLWWFPCPSGPIHAIHADTDHIHIHTGQYTLIPANTEYTLKYMQIWLIHVDTYRFLHMHAYTCNTPTPQT